MSLKIFVTDTLSSYLRSYNNLVLPFDIEGDYWEYVYDADKADIFLITLFADKTNIKLQIDFLTNLGYDFNKHYLLIVELFHIEETQFDNQSRALNFYYEILGHKKICILHHNSNIKDAYNFIYLDFLFNRQKLYMTDLEKIKDKINQYSWTHLCQKNHFKLNEIKLQKAIYQQFNSTLKYLAPMRIYTEKNSNFRGHKFFRHSRCRYRYLLYNFLLCAEKNLGYLSNIQEGLELESEDPQIKLKDLPFNGGGTWIPVANKYYESSYWSTYVETLTLGNFTKSLTEKTFDPLIKGHFILPFGYQGIIEDIKNYGFVLPDWIDYSFDNIEDDDLRFLKYLESLHLLLKIDTEELDSLYKRDLHILHHNRNVFYEKPYDLLYNKVINWINSVNN